MIGGRVGTRGSTELVRLLAHGHAIWTPRDLTAFAEPSAPQPGPISGGADGEFARLLDTLLPAPACIFGPRFDFVAWNETFSRIWRPDRLPAGRRSAVWMAFCETDRRRTWINWEERSAQPSRRVPRCRRPARRRPDVRRARRRPRTSQQRVQNMVGQLRGAPVHRRAAQDPHHGSRRHKLRRHRVAGLHPPVPATSRFTLPPGQRTSESSTASRPCPS